MFDEVRCMVFPADLLLQVITPLFLAVLLNSLHCFLRRNSASSSLFGVVESTAPSIFFVVVVEFRLASFQLKGSVQRERLVAQRSKAQDPESVSAFMSNE